MNAQTPEPLITRHRRVVSGSAVFVGTRIPVWILTGNLESDRKMSEFLRNYPSLQRDYVLQVLRRGEELLAADAATGG